MAERERATPTIFERMERERRRQGWTVGRLIKAAGVPRSAYYKWRDGVQEPSVASLVKIARALRVSMDYLAGLQDATDQPAIPDVDEEEEAILLAFRHDDAFKAIALAALRALGNGARSPRA